MGEAQTAEMHRHVIEGVDDHCIEFLAVGDEAMKELKRRFRVFKDNYQVEFYAPEGLPLREKYIRVEDLSAGFRGHTRIEGINGARISAIEALSIESCSPMKGGMLQRGGPDFDVIHLTVDSVLMSYGVIYGSKGKEAPAQDQTYKVGE